MEPLNLTFPLSLPQQDIYYEQILYPELPIYNIGARIDIHGQLDMNLIKNAYALLINQHDAYRTIIQSTNNKPGLKVLERHGSELELIDFSDKSNSKEWALEFIEENFKTPFDLNGRKLLHKFVLIKVEDSFYHLFSVYHHIITDGWGTSLMFKRLVKNYNELLEFGEIQSTYPYYYTRFIEDDLNYQKSEDYQKDKEYWQGIFYDLPDSLIPLIKKKECISRQKKLIIKRRIYNQINELAIELKVSTFHIILGILYTYLARFYQNDEITIGIPVLNRGKSIFKKTVGLFMGISPLRIRFDFDGSFEDLVLFIKNQLRQNYRHQRFPLGKLIRELNMFQEKERLFNVTLSYEKQDYVNHFRNTRTSVIPLSHNSERVALAIYIREFDENEDVTIDFDYNTSYLDDGGVSRLVASFQNVLNEVISNPNRLIKDFRLIPKQEITKILACFNDTNIELPINRTIVDLFKEITDDYTMKIAVSDGQNQLTYKELDVLSDYVASYIQQHFNKDRNPIAILMNRSADLLVVLLGVMKSGHPYLPLDPSFPFQRLKYILEHSQSNYIITDRKLSKKFKFNNKLTVYINMLLSQNGQYEKANYPKPDTSAYVIYTSGSTGNPKGVEISHRSLLNFLWSMKITPGISHQDVLFAVTTYSFDISILELFLPIISGSLVYIATEQVLSDPNNVIKEIEKINPTILQATPSFYQLLYDAGWKGHKNLKILCGGDLISEALTERLINNSKEVWNMYGPTETTIWSSTKRMLKPKDSRNIGKPIHNTTFYILDEWLNPVPIGAVGKIFIGGEGLAKGYFLNKELTNDSFIRSPFEINQKIYDTGDVATWIDNGEIKFLGRNDNQVKVRGYRIELREIEKKLTDLDFILEAVVVVKGSGETSLLVAFVKSIKGFETELVIEALNEKLPNYMIPNIIHSLTEFPLTPNNKIDRKALAQKKDIFFQKQTEGLILPINETEKKLYRLWKKVLGLDQVSVTDNFFRLGGHSLNAVRLIHQINNQFSYDLTQKDIFDYPTIQSLSKRIAQTGKKSITKIPKAKIKKYYSLTYPQRNIWLASQIKEASIAYNMNAIYEVKGELNIDILKQSIVKIIGKYEILRTNFLEIAGVPKQFILSLEEIVFNISETHLHDSDLEKIISAFVKEEYDLQNEILLRVKIIHKSDNDCVLCFSTHHIIIDGWSIEIFIKELRENYIGIAERSTNLELQFKDYSEWLTSQAIDKHAEKFWAKMLNGYSAKELFKKDYSEVKLSFDGDIAPFSLSEDMTSFYKKFAKENGTTDYLVLISLFYTFIYKYSSYRDICFGAVTSGRNNSLLTDQMGMFVNTIPLRLKIDGNDTIKDVLFKAENILNSAINFENFPISDIISNYAHPFNILFVFQNPEFSIKEINVFQDAKIRPYKLNYKVSRLPMTFNFSYENDSFYCDLEYNSDMYSKDTIYYIIEKFKKLLSEVMSNSIKKLDDYDITLEIENSLKQKINIEFKF